MRSLPEIKAMNAAAVDRNVVVHLRARQADIYEKALRKIDRRQNRAVGDAPVLARALNDIEATVRTALRRAERLR